MRLLPLPPPPPPNSSSRRLAFCLILLGGDMEVQTVKGNCWKGTVRIKWYQENFRRCRLLVCCYTHLYSSPRNGGYISLYIIYKIFRKLLESGLTAFLNINYTKWIFKRTWWQHILKTIAIFSIFYGVVGDYSKEHILWIRTYVRRKNRAHNRRYKYYQLYIFFWVLRLKKKKNFN